MKRILAIVLSLAMILVVFLMAGCGENDTPETTKGSEPADTTASDKPGTSGGTSSGEEAASPKIPPLETTVPLLRSKLMAIISFPAMKMSISEERPLSL